MNNRRICFFNTTKAWGGGEKWHYDIAQYFLGKLNLVMAITNKDSELHSRFMKTEVKTIALKVKKFDFLNPLKVQEIANVLIENKIDIIVMNLSSDMKVAGLAAKKAGVQHIIYRRGSAIPIKNNFINRYFFRHIITEILANSEETKRTILQNNKSLFPANKIKVIYNGMDIHKFDSFKATKLYKRETNECLIGNAGRLAKQKNQKALIKVAKYLSEKKLNFKILIAGEGKLKQQLIDLAKQEGVADKIIFIGFVENIKDFTETIDVFVLTSFWEGFGYVLAEAMLSSKPVVAFDSSSNPEIIDDKKTGFLIQNLDELEMAKKIESLILDKKRQLELGTAGRKRVENLFTIEKTYKNMENYLSKLVNK